MTKGLLLLTVGAVFGAGIMDIVQTTNTPLVTAQPATVAKKSTQELDVQPSLKERIIWCRKRVVCSQLAKAVVYEARSEPLIGRYAVAYVVVNRVQHKQFPKSVGKVLTQGKQFSYQKDWHKQSRPRQADWDEAYAVAFDVLNKKVDDPTSGALFYHSHRVAPKWKNSVSYTMTIGNHIFYK